MPSQTYEMQVGVLFADIRVYTSFAETHGTASAAQTLSRFYEAAHRALIVDDVFVEFVGDQVMAFYPVDMPSLGKRANEIMLSQAVYDHVAGNGLHAQPKILELKGKSQPLNVYVLAS